MTDPDTIASLAAEFSLNPDVVRLIMDAAEQHPGVVDPIALGRSWLRKRAQAERGKHQTSGQVRELTDAETARVDAGYYVSKFFDSVRYTDSRKRSEWEAWAVARADEGWTTDAIVAHVAKRWREWRGGLRALAPTA